LTAQEKIAYSPNKESRLLAGNHLTQQGTVATLDRSVLNCGEGARRRETRVRKSLKPQEGGRFPVLRGLPKTRAFTEGGQNSPADIEGSSSRGKGREKTGGRNIFLICARERKESRTSIDSYENSLSGKAAARQEEVRGRVSIGRASSRDREPVFATTIRTERSLGTARDSHQRPLFNQKVQTSL